MKKPLTRILIVYTVICSYAQDSITNSIYHFSSTQPAFAEGILLVPSVKAQIASDATYNYYDHNLHEIHHPNFSLIDVI